jgi:hypothetical protein
MRPFSSRERDLHRFDLELIDRTPADDVSPTVRRIMRFRSITTLCLFGAAAFVALKYALIGLGICICCLIVYLGIIRIIALLGLACATGVSEAAAGSDTEQCRSDRHEAYRFMAASDETTCPARGAGLPHAASGSRSGGSSLRMNPARFTAMHQATTYLAGRWSVAAVS